MNIMREGIDCKGRKWIEYIKPYPKRYDITGQVFGDLTVLFRVDVDSYRNCALWLCKCICGNEIVVRATALRSEHTKSCGCSRRSAGELTIEHLLSENNISYKSEYSFSDLPRLRYDFVIFDENQSPIRIIEFDREQHFKSIDYFGGKEGFKQRKNHDTIKNQYAFDHNIPIVRFPYTNIKELTFDAIMGDKYLLHSPS